MRLWLLVLATVALAASSLAAQTASAPPIAAFAPCPWGSPDCNVCVADVVGAISQLRTHGDAMGFHMNGAPDVTLFDHWEGVQRLMGDEGRHLVVSRALSEESQDVSFAIVRMASRDDDGLRFRSNRLDPSTTHPRHAAPGERPHRHDDAARSRLQACGRHAGAGPRAGRAIREEHDQAAGRPDCVAGCFEGRLLQRRAPTQP